MARFTQVVQDDSGWSEWIQPVRKGYKLACCDCGLVHNVDFRVLKRNSTGARTVQFRVGRNARSTALMRRHKKRKRAKL